jgi:vacuolar-type H+-ATPase subunit H
MIEDKPKSFEEIFNDWYKKFLEQENGMNNEIKQAKKFKDEKLQQARKEAMETIKNYEIQQRDKLEADKEKLNVTKNYFEQMDTDFKKEVELMRQQHKDNKDKVINYLLDHILNVDLSLPPSILEKKENEGKKKKKIQKSD